MPNEFEIECDENSFTLVVATPAGQVARFGIPDPEALYDHVKAAIGPWLYERDQAKQEFDRMKRANDTRLMDDQQFTEYLDDAYGDDWSKRVGMEQMREQGIA